jgi:hypothetical protein
LPVATGDGLIDETAGSGSTVIAAVAVASGDAVLRRAE